MEPGDEVTTTLGGRLVRGTVLYVRDGSVRIDVPGRKPITRPIARVKLVRVKALPAGARCRVAGCEKMRGYYLNECYEHAGPNPYADGDTAMSEPVAAKVLAAIVRPVCAVPKPPKPDRNAAYLAWIRLRHCCVCHRQATEAHHFGPRGTGQKCSDYLTVPLCTSCHREFHDTGKCRWSSPEETRETFLNTQRECMSLWVEEQLHGDVAEIVVAALLAHIREASK